MSAAVVAVGEIGDKTQLLALLLAARFRRPIPIVLGILVATLLNHSLAALLGEWIRTALSPQVLRWSLAVSFLAIAAMALKPDKLEQAPRDIGGYGAFAFTALAFFLAEFGDKTQLATIALAAHFGSLVTVVAGTTTGMLIVDAPVVYFARKAAPRIPFTTVRYVAAALFAALGLVAATGLQLRL